MALKSRRRRRRSFLPILLTVTVVLLCVVGALWLYSFLCDRWERMQYPLHYEALVEDAAQTYGVPAPVLYAVIRCESSFTPTAVSHAGAVGLMQIMPSTYDWLRTRPGAPPEGELTEPGVNIAYGAFLLSILYDEFGDWRITWAAYNAGINRVRSWLREDPELQTIPIAETATYVTRVSHALQMYESLYFNQK